MSMFKKLLIIASQIYHKSDEALVRIATFLSNIITVYS